MSAIAMPTSSLSPRTESAAVRFHVGLNAADLLQSVHFYTALFGQPPARNLNDYVRFEVAEPPLILALYPSPPLPGGPLNHVGLRLRDSVQLVAVQRRLEEAGIATQRQDDVECCYSRQTKFWITDPDRNLWEIYTLHEDIEHSGFDDAPVSTRVLPPQAVWEHRITEAVPTALEFAEESLDEVRLEGTFNALLPDGSLPRLLSEMQRVLKPGGRIKVRGLVGDRVFPGTPKLPGMAALVQRVPVETEPLEQIRAAGFVDVQFDKLGDIHCFQVNGVELRELRISASKRPPQEGQPVGIIYKGPFAEIELDEGLILRRGEIQDVPQSLARRLTSGAAAGSFGLVQNHHSENS